MDMDLYGDLDDSLFSSGREQIAVEEVDSALLAVTNELGEARGKISKLEMQNAALKKNISCLFKTAQLEIQRKDAVIQSLRDKIADTESSHSKRYSANHKRGDGPGHEPQPFSCSGETGERTSGKENIEATLQDPSKHVTNSDSLRAPSTPSPWPKYHALQGPGMHNKNDSLSGPPKRNDCRAPPNMATPHGIDEKETRKHSSELCDMSEEPFRLGGEYKCDGGTRKRSRTALSMDEYPESDKFYNREHKDFSNSSNLGGHCSEYGDGMLRKHRSYNFQNTLNGMDQIQRTSKHPRPCSSSDGHRM